MKYLLATLSALFFATTVHAATLPAFTFDEGNSSIDVTPSGSLCFACSLSAEFASGVDGMTWNPTSPNDSWYIGDFIDWTAAGSFGGAAYDVSATIAFSAPSSASTSGTGNAAYASFFGVISGGVLSWNSFSPITFADGSVLDVILDGGIGLFGTTQTTGVTFVGNDISVVPVPAAIGLLLGGLGAFGVLGLFRGNRRQTMA